MSEATFTLRIDKDLKDAFTEAAKSKERTAAQLIREYMRDTVQETQRQKDYDTWFARKVAEGRSDIALGRVVDNDTVLAEAAERRTRLLAKLESAE